MTNVPYEVEWQQLRDHFAAAGHPVVFARINTDSRSGRPLGSGVVQFESAAQANEAMEKMSGTPLLGRRITCRADMHWRPAEKYEEEAPGPAAAEGEGPAWAAKTWSRVAGTEDDGAAAAGLDEERVLDLVPPEKDVDGLTERSMGRLVRGRPGHVPCTPLGVMRLLEEALTGR